MNNKLRSAFDNSSIIAETHIGWMKHVQRIHNKSGKEDTIGKIRSEKNWKKKYIA